MHLEFEDYAGLVKPTDQEMIATEKVVVTCSSQKEKRPQDAEPHGEVPSREGEGGKERAWAGVFTGVFSAWLGKEGQVSLGLHNLNNLGGPWAVLVVSDAEAI